MHDHLSEYRQDPYRPKSDRVEEQLLDSRGRAAAEKRPDVLGADGLLGLQRVAGNAGVTSMLEEERSPVHDVISSGGRSLDPDTRANMEGRFGADFGDVKIHDDAAAASSAKSVNAHAYTVGSNIVFQRDAYDPGSPAGQTTLAHELTHVLQQRSGPVDGESAPGGIKVSDPGDRFEREAAANADRIMSTPAAAPAVAPAGAAVQRHAEEEDTLQGSFLPGAEVQRDEVPEEDEDQVQGLFVQREGEELEEEDQPPA